MIDDGVGMVDGVRHAQFLCECKDFSAEIDLFDDKYKLLHIPNLREAAWTLRLYFAVFLAALWPSFGCGINIISECL